MKKAREKRSARRAALENKIKLLEDSPQADPSNPTLIDLKNPFKLEELLAAEQSIKFTREFWAGRIDTPDKEMFKLLKRKNVREIIPPLLDE